MFSESYDQQHLYLNFCVINFDQHFWVKMVNKFLKRSNSARKLAGEEGSKIGQKMAKQIIFLERSNSARKLVGVYSKYILVTCTQLMHLLRFASLLVFLSAVSFKGFCGALLYMNLLRADQIGSPSSQRLGVATKSASVRGLTCCFCCQERRSPAER